MKNFKENLTENYPLNLFPPLRKATNIQKQKKRNYNLSTCGYKNKPKKKVKSKMR